jgi:class 3 adenylate cyclase/DNA-binding winged helix-turn-helix (wHTH) protein
MRYVFGGYSLDTQCYELRRAGELIPLGPQVFNVLAYLVAYRDRVVSRDELFARLWPDQFVTDDALGRCIRAARRALEDRPEAPRYITTTRGRGYRFIAPVQERPHTSPEDGMLTTVPGQSIPPPPSVAGGDGLPPVPVPTVSGELQRPSEEFRPPSLAGEYKQVAVLCGGLADALALAGRLGPEAMHRRMQTVFTVVQQVLHRYAGSLIEFGGEGFVALFGAPVAQEDHAQRAVLAALALHAHVGASAPDLSQAPAEPLVLCLGLHAGRVVVDGLGGDPQRLYTATGETTQVALRLRQLAAPGTTLLSAVTQQLVQENVLAEPRGEVQLGASQAPVPVYGVRGIAHQRSGVVGHGARARSPFVGRARELALLQERLDAVVAGQGQVVAVVGEPGMGKSRLLAEYRRRLVGREVRYVEGHCLSYGSATPYLPVVDLVRRLCGMTPGEQHEAITTRVHDRLQQADLDPDEGVPLVLSLLDIPIETERLTQLSPPERKARTFALLRHLVLHEAQRQPCILTVENLHWSDATSDRAAGGRRAAGAGDLSSGVSAPLAGALIRDPNRVVAPVGWGQSDGAAGGAPDRASARDGGPGDHHASGGESLLFGRISLERHRTRRGASRAAGGARGDRGGAGGAHRSPATGREAPAADRCRHRDGCLRAASSRP